MRATLLLTSLALLTATTHAQDAAPLDIKGFRLGMPQAEAVAKGGLECSRLAGTTRTFCSKSWRSRNEAVDTVAGVPTTYFHVGILPDETVGSIYVTFAADQFDKVRQALASKYPTLQCKNSIVQNRAGASFDQVDCDMAQNGHTLLLEKRSSKVDISSINLISAAQFKELQESEAARKEKAKKDI